ncbi:MAG: phage tail assembly chaperone [Parvibaculum sp.]|uniref:phage tail assembly chaperone n=1 Tax=Parvibaculum sp. TaxID=2024848 RepID=UPI003C73BA81
MKTFPWARAMEIGLGHLRLAPQDFWRMTLPELAAAANTLGLRAPQRQMTRAELASLAERFPDLD